jgi:hypothetical protein
MVEYLEAVANDGCDVIIILQLEQHGLLVLHAVFKS